MSEESALADELVDAGQFLNRKHVGGEYGNRKAQVLLDRHSNASRDVIQRRIHPFTGGLGDCSIALLLKATDVPWQRIDWRR